MRSSKAAARRPRAPSFARATLAEDIAHSRGLDLKYLRARWRSMTGRDAPPHLSRPLLFAIVAYRVQADALGDLDTGTIRYLDTIQRAGSASAKSLTAAFDQRRRILSLGTVLTREWNGQMHRVMVVNGGFAFDGRAYDSLSAIASAITGTKWNGPRFFGLRDKKPTEVTP